MGPQTAPPSPPCAVPSLYPLPVMLFLQIALSMNTNILTVLTSILQVLFHLNNQELPIMEFYLYNTF